MHARESIRSAFVLAVTGLTTTSTRVYESRVLPIPAGTSPSLCVYTRSDTVDYSKGRMNRIVTRVIELHVEGYAEGTDQSVLDDIAAEVETAVFASATLAAMKIRFWLGDQTVSVDDSGDVLVSRIDMIFNVEYSVAEGLPSTLV